MTNMRKLLLLLTLLCSAAQADDWSRTDKALFATYATLSAVDALQYKYILDHPEQFREANSILEGSSFGEVVLVKTAVAGAMFLLLDARPQDRRAGLWLLVLLQGAIVAHNHRIGVRVEF